MLHKSKVIGAKGVRVIGSVMHFTFQTAADLVLESEVKALDALDVYDLSSKDLKQARMERTKRIQYKLKDATETLLKHSKGSFKSNNGNSVEQAINI